MENIESNPILEKARQIYSIRKNAPAVRTFLTEENIPEARQDRIIEILKDEIGPEETVKPGWQTTLAVIIFIFAIIRLLYRISK